MTGVQKVRLNSLNINIKNALVMGIIIAKNCPRTFGPKKKSSESRGVMSFTIRDSQIDTINVDVWGSDYFVMTIYNRFIVGDVVEIHSPKICVKSGANETFRPQVSSPFYLSINEGSSDVSTFSGDTYGAYLPLLHVPSKSSAGYCGLAEVMKFTGVEMPVRAVEIVDNTTPASLYLDMFDTDTIQRAEEWRPLGSVLFIADARVTWRGRGARAQVCGRSVVTHQPHTSDAEALRLYIQNQAAGGEAAAWAEWSGQRSSAASVAQVRDRLADGAPFCASLHALLTHLDLDDLINSTDNNSEELRVRFADYTGELTARLPTNILQNTFGYSAQQIKAMSSEERAAVRWRLLLEQCCAKLAATPPRLIVLSLRRANPADPISLY
ncbi:PREDICTED: meiosis-specific with OB domain-containing protein-like isoform X2 [Papilio xuthus]|uniref:Meiosis-specific with OB domain-containing protein-like isoform X2 n=1 Tax=Papilio xuthus TaxID=66420 RepID=A0AAJ6ZGB2_PAPXU|nr:PREDICTED: meiosis-specific with OB domain-containing protein-like isoform X2 [Papilio xuthus]